MACALELIKCKGVRFLSRRATTDGAESGLCGMSWVLSAKPSPPGWSEAVRLDIDDDCPARQFGLEKVHFFTSRAVGDDGVGVDFQPLLTPRPCGAPGPWAMDRARRQVVEGGGTTSLPLASLMVRVCPRRLIVRVRVADSAIP